MVKGQKIIFMQENHHQDDATQDDRNILYHQWSPGHCWREEQSVHYTKHLGGAAFNHTTLFTTPAYLQITLRKKHSWSKSWINNFQ